MHPLLRPRIRKPPVRSPHLATSTAARSRSHDLSLRRSSAPPPRIAAALRWDPSADAATSRSNSSITHLSKLGKISRARQVFDEMPLKDVVSWTAIISSYVRCAMIREARALFDHPEAKRNVVTWTALLSGYVRAGRVEEAEELFHVMPDKNVVSWNTMICGYAENGLLEKACEVFEQMPERNVVSWNTIINALVQSGDVDKAMRLFKRMTERDVISWTSMVAGLAQNGRVDDARKLFDKMPTRNIISWNAMISGYAQNGRVEEAVELFGKMPERDVASWNTMITGFIQNGHLAKARTLFDSMVERNVVTWTSLITGYAQDGQGEEALHVFMQMQRDGIKPNQGTFVSILVAVSDLAGLQEGRQLHQLVSKTMFQHSPFVESALISMYAKCGKIATARKLFNEARRKDLVMWNSMIAAYAHHGCGKEAIELFEEMLCKGFKPDGATYVGILSACSHSGLVDEGFKLFDSLLRDGSIEVREDHYACLVDLCGRAGRLDEVASFIDSHDLNLSSSCIWGALLAGCNVHGNEKIGKLAAKRLMEIEPGNAGTYMLLSNIYSSAGKYKAAAKMRIKMKGHGLKKQPGCSWIEVLNKVHVFVVRDKSHRDYQSIYSALLDLHDKMKKAGYVPKVELDLERDHDWNITDVQV